MSDTGNPLVTEDAPQEQAPPAQETITIPVDPPAPVAPTARTFTAEDMEKARREEKDKLYPRLQTMEAEIAAAKADREAREAAEAKALADAEEARRATELAEMTAADRIEALSAQMEERVRVAEGRAAAIEATWQQEQNYQQLVAYRAQRLADPEIAQNLIPELADLVTGSSVEEIDNALALVLDKSAAIMEQVAAATQQQRQQQRGASVTAPPIGPMDNETTYQQLTPADIAAMDPQTYAQNRDKLMAAAMQKARSGGIYS